MDRLHETSPARSAVWLLVPALCMAVQLAPSGCKSDGAMPLRSHDFACSTGEMDPRAADSTQAAAAESNAPQEPAHPDSPATGPEISFILPRPVPFRMDFSVPPDPPAVVDLTPVTFDAATQARLRELVRAEMTKSPPGTLGAVSQVFIGGTLLFSGQPVGGCHFLGLVFIAAGEADAGAVTDAHVARAFHHEAAHALLDAHGTVFDAARFRAALPAGFAYRDETPGVVPAQEAPLGSAEDAPSLDLLGEGFLVPWARDRMHEDVCSYAEVLLREPSLLLGLFAPDSRVGRKARVLRDLYIAVDPRFAALFESDRATLTPPSPPTTRVQPSPGR